MLKSWLLLWACCSVAGCATPHSPWLAPLQPASLKSDVQIRQHIVMQRGDQTYALQVAMRVDAERLTLIGLSDLGQRLFTLSSDGHQARLISPSSDLKGLDPDLILTEFELVYWPLAELNTALPQELRLEQQGSLRTLWRGEKLLWFSVNESQDRWCGNVFIYNLERDYRLDIQPLSPVKPTS